MKPFDWNKEKNEKLKEQRNISFEEIARAIQKGDLLDDTSHPNKKKYIRQKMYVVSINEYAYLVPYVENKEKIFLKTIIPSRKATKKYILTSL